ncbi:Carboxysome shell and ethanolamine utilization microcompartment protein CcmL/EutN [Geosporobacter subterraneus DSM 17957]|uniref:Carboxysome shell and ethanolamine utilization microcompartment protein CcmL/EutN n=2 Tax=Geosporobacter TaxID=390805 RepID=A0A1M6JRJ6_9FIRM|nr:Carboxysome shell and ethanolamine utilization microcompartment protein CcmL/EutN [Geosporobacter subterraneus DSM 17957]
MMKGYALGLVESLGYVGAVEAADVCMKAANVSLIDCEIVTGGLVTIKISGEVGAVKAAIDAAEAAVRKVGTLVSTHVIPRPSTELYKILNRQEESPVDAIQKPEELQDRQEQEEAPVEAVQGSGNTEYTGSSTEYEQKSEEVLRAMKVVELRTLARQIPHMPIDRNDIKFAKKEELIDAILSCYRKEEC